VAEHARLVQQVYKEEVNYQDMGNTCSRIFPTIYPDAQNRLTTYGLSLMLKQVQASQMYVVQPCTSSTCSPERVSLETDELLEPDLRDLPRFKTLQQFLDVNAGLCTEDNMAVLVKLKHTIAAASNPQFVLLTRKVEGRNCYQDYLCTCGSSIKSGMPCRHFWAVLQYLRVASFHFGMVNDLWFKAAQPQTQKLQLYAFDARAGVPAHIFDFQRALFSAVAQTPDEEEGEEGSSIEDPRARLQRMRTVGNLLGLAKKAIDMVQDSPELCEQLFQVLDNLVNSTEERPQIRNPAVAKTKGRPKQNRKAPSQLVAFGKKRRPAAHGEVMHACIIISHFMKLVGVAQ
jgi:hypothetical protein